MKHRVTKSRYDDGEIIPNCYIYRDVEFERSETVSTGYHGRYFYGGYRKGWSCTTQKEMLQHIDEKTKSQTET